MNSIQYDPFLVGLSYVISVFGSYTALQLAIALRQIAVEPLPAQASRPSSDRMVS